MSQSNREPSEPWQQRWQAGRTGWDQGGRHPELERLLRLAVELGPLQPGARIYAAGCGRAHNEAWLANRGFQLTAVDIVERAIEEARHLYTGQSGLAMSVADVFDDAGDAESYDAVFDRAMLCALAPQNRRAYINKLTEKLRPGGLVMSILFRAVRSPEGPPFAVTEAEAWELFGQDFRLCHASSCRAPEHPHNVLEEWLCIWAKREDHTSKKGS